MFEGETELAWRWHKDCPEGKIFPFSEVPELEKNGWVDSPAKLIEEPDAEKATEEESIKVKPDYKLIETVNIPEKLLNGEGMNFSSYLRAHGADPKDQNARKKFRSLYDKVLKEYEGRIYKQGYDWFLKDK